MINAVANQTPCHLQIASVARCPFGPSRTQVRNAVSWRLQGTPMTGLAQNETTWSGRHDGGEVVDRDLIAPFAMMMLAMLDCRLVGGRSAMTSLCLRASRSLD